MSLCFEMFGNQRHRQGGGYPIAEPLFRPLAMTLQKVLRVRTCVQGTGGLSVGLISIFVVLSK